jgi:nitrogen regulatory protein PII
MPAALRVIRAYVQPHVLDRLVQALLEIPDFPGLSVSDCLGFGREKARSGADYVPFYAKKRLEIYAPAGQVEAILAVLTRIAHSGQRGDGKVYVADVAEGLRLSTLERGPDLA